MPLSMDESPERCLSATKRRRKMKANADKKFECKHEGCGKTYSRAEHLYRHHLNHEPKAIYHCRHPGCNRSFVRQDLCVRHQERHSTQGSQLQKRDASSQVSPPAVGRDTSFLAGSNPGPVAVPSTCTDSTTTTTIRSENYVTALGDHVAGPAKHGHMSDSIASTSPTSIESRNQPPTPRTVLPGLGLSLRHDHSPTSYTRSPPYKHAVDSTSRAAQRKSFSGDFERWYGTAGGGISPTAYRSNSYHESQSSALRTPVHVKGSTDADHNFQPDLHFALSTPAGFSGSGPETSRTSIATAVAHSFSALNPMSPTHYSFLGDTPGAGYAYPIFGGDEYNRSPIARESEFAAWLFGDNQQAITTFIPAPNVLPGYVDLTAPGMQGSFYSDRQFDAYYPPNAQPQHPMSVTSLLDPTAPPQTCMSEEKRQELLDLMREQFQARPHDAVRGCEHVLVDGDIDADSHILSLRMLHSYVGSYFYHQHAQLPILHRPTFCADKTHNLLLLMVIAIGAATLDKAYGNALTDTAADFANFIAWHVRWEIVRDEGYRPPAKLWTFQTLILLEVYEKMYSTRVLHERAHINHDTTLTLMRRGTSFIDKTPSESPGSLPDGKTARSSGSNSASDAVASDESWSQWVRNEATRRIAFAAFVIDSIHATMFGHSAKMLAYEINLPLPCDEALWSATSAVEVARVQSSHQTNGVKPIMFLDGLKRTLNGEKVRTNSFGRTILMCGLLSVNYLINQRDIQVTALGAANVQGSESSNKWRATLLRAFDNWKKDFDETLAEAHPSVNHSTSMTAFGLRRIDDDNLFESRIVLHHLAHMASSVDIFDCQIYAGARRLLGRPIGIKDLARVRDKMVHRWVRTPSARDAVFHALKFLIQVLVQPAEAACGVTILPHAFDERGQYLARDDFLLNRPWVLYFSVLVVWCYGFALEGAVSPADQFFATPNDRERDMNAFLDRVGRINRPGELESIQGMNRSVGLLMVLKDSFEATRWELTREAALLLENCIAKSLAKT